MSAVAAADALAIVAAIVAAPGPVIADPVPAPHGDESAGRPATVRCRAVAPAPRPASASGSGPGPRERDEGRRQRFVEKRRRGEMNLG